MRILILNQAFSPDVVATAQYATDLAQALVGRGHQVTVVCSERAYDDRGKRFGAYECMHGVEVIRVGGSGFGKASKWRRAVDFGSFFVACAARVLRLRRFDLVIAMTT